jgi:predicted nucleotidyltransferase
VIEKITSVAQSVYQGEQPKIVLFGSLMTGLALESSDMDMAVTGLKIDDRTMMI